MTTEIQKLIDDESKKYGEIGSRVFIRGTIFYEQTILPKILEDRITAMDRNIPPYSKEHNVWYDKMKREILMLQSQLSQLQNSLEEEKRKAFEAAKKGKAIPLIYSGGSIWESDFPTFDDYLNSTNQSPETNH